MNHAAETIVPRFRPGRITALLALCVIVSASLRGGEEDTYRQLMRRYEKVNSQLQHMVQEMDRPAPLPDYPARLLSPGKNASVTIGGELRVNYIGGTGTSVNPDPAGDLNGYPKAESKSAGLSTTTARLSVDARIGRRWRTFLEMNLNGHFGLNRVSRVRNPNAPGAVNPAADYLREESADYLNQAYIELLKDGHSGFGFKAGRMFLPFGLEGRPDLIGRSFMDAPDLTASRLMNPQAWNNAVRLPHASRFVDPVIAAVMTYELRDIIRFEAAVFQDIGNAQARISGADGVARYRSENELPRSWQAGLSILPLEGWELSTHFRNRHSRTRGLNYWADSPFRADFRRNMASGGGDPSWDPEAGQWSSAGAGPGFGSRSNEQAFIVGLRLEIPNTAWSVQAEYAHGWNQGFNKYLNSDGVNLALAYRLTPRLTLHGQAEWLHVKDRSWLVADGSGGWVRDTRNNRLHRILLGAEYEFMRGLTLEGGWQYEYWNMASSIGGGGATREERINTSNMFYMGTRFIF